MCFFAVILCNSAVIFCCNCAIFAVISKVCFSSLNKCSFYHCFVKPLSSPTILLYIHHFFCGWLFFPTDLSHKSYIITTVCADKDSQCIFISDHMFLLLLLLFFIDFLNSFVYFGINFSSTSGKKKKRRESNLERKSKLESVL